MDRFEQHVTHIFAEADLAAGKACVQVTLRAGNQLGNSRLAFGFSEAIEAAVKSKIPTIISHYSQLRPSFRRAARILVAKSMDDLIDRRALGCRESEAFGGSRNGLLDREIPNVKARCRNEFEAQADLSEGARKRHITERHPIIAWVIGTFTAVFIAAAGTWLAGGVPAIVGASKAIWRAIF